MTPASNVGGGSPSSHKKLFVDVDALHGFGSEEPFVVWELVHEQPSVECDVVVGDFVFIAGGNDHGFPPDAIDDEPRGEVTVSFLNGLKGELFE